MQANKGDHEKHSTVVEVMAAVMDALPLPLTVAVAVAAAAAAAVVVVVVVI